jgi:hypothetical protein
MSGAATNHSAQQEPVQIDVPDINRLDLAETREPVGIIS